MILITDLMAKHRRISLNHPCIVQWRLNKLLNLFICHLQSIDQLIMRIYHASIKEMGFLLIFDNAKSSFQSIKPMIQSAKLEIFNGTRCRNQLNILNFLCTSISVKLADFLNSMIRKPLLDVGVKATWLKKSGSKQKHTFIWIFAKQTAIHQRLPIPNTVRDFYIFRFRYESPINQPCSNCSFMKYTFIIIHNQNVFWLDLNRVDNTTKRQRNIRLKCS